MNQCRLEQILIGETLRSFDWPNEFDISNTNYNFGEYRAKAKINPVETAQITMVKIHPANTPYNNDQLTPFFPSTNPTPTVDPTLQ